MTQFASLQEEVNFWKSRCEEIEKDFEEYQMNSQMLEKELETSLEQAEKTNRELKTKNNHLILENETLFVSLPHNVYRSHHIRTFLNTYISFVRSVFCESEKFPKRA